VGGLIDLVEDRLKHPETTSKKLQKGFLASSGTSPRNVVGGGNFKIASMKKEKKRKKKKKIIVQARSYNNGTIRLRCGGTKDRRDFQECVPLSASNVNCCDAISDTPREHSEKTLKKGQMLGCVGERAR